MGWFRRKFHQFCYRVYMNGKNERLKRENEKRIDGVHLISNLKNLQLGEDVSFGGEVMIMGGGEISIGSNSMIGASTIIHSTTHDYTIHPMNGKTINKNTVIGKHVWIGTGVIINPGVKIGDYSVVGSGSVVTKNVDEGAIVAGIPARIIKSRDAKIYK